MKIIKAIPLSEVNGIKFGAKREEVRKVFGEAKEFKKTSLTTCFLFLIIHHTR